MEENLLLLVFQLRTRWLTVQTVLLGLVAVLLLLVLAHCVTMVLFILPVVMLPTQSVILPLMG